MEHLTAADILQRDLVTIGPRDSLRDALDLMTENHVSGLPVVDERDVCVGLISATDILNHEEEHAGDATADGADMVEFFNAETGKWESLRASSFSLEKFGDTLVQELMTRELICVPLEATIPEIARTLADADVHRALVLTRSGGLRGIISAMDLVRVIAGRHAKSPAPK
ncbi:MAG: CBS domain-containing protein [Pirellulales bacterium]|nr:CBS domain-containing protein [Pirellulales bacterium]MBX3433035.1 CBS domain-containing protein [Pirellulales bacterium]